VKNGISLGLEHPQSQNLQSLWSALCPFRASIRVLLVAHELVYHLNLGLLMWLKTHAEQLSMVNEEWNHLHHRMNMVIVLELTKQKNFVPVVLEF
jgi:hypothetical protein